MNILYDNIYIFIFIGILVLIYLLNYYIRSCIDSEVVPLKKKMKRLSTIIQMHQVKNPEQNKIDQVKGAEVKKLEFTHQSKSGNLIDDSEGIYEKTDADGDSYFDPTKSCEKN
jgi:hypothetical protein